MDDDDEDDDAILYAVPFHQNLENKLGQITMATKKPIRDYKETYAKYKFYLVRFSIS